MFQRNEGHRQRGLFDGEQHLPPMLRERLEDSWAEVFYHEVFCRIDETLFAGLYSETTSRPNAPANVLMGMEILKSGFGWSDRELERQVQFNLQVRYALGLSDWSEAPPRLRTLYNFRARVREYAAEEGVNLYGKAFEQVTDEQLRAIGVETKWQRMDSTQVLSNLAQTSRLELVLAVVGQVVASAPSFLRERLEERFGERLSDYTGKRPHEVAYRIPAGEAEEHLERLGSLLLEIAEHLGREHPGSEAAGLARRVLSEQYELSCELGADGKRPDDGEGPVVALRAPQEISAESLQSPHDPEATYRKKGGESYRGGYVVNVSETCAQENVVQLITDVQVAPNQTDDAELLARSLEAQEERETGPECVTTDGGYSGPTGEEACEEHGAELQPTRLRGGKSKSGRLGWEDYEWEMSPDGTPVYVTCPQSERAEVSPAKAEGRYLARFEREACASCPLLGGGCRVQERKRTGPTLYTTARAVEVALLRQGLSEEDRAVRAVVESTVRSLKHPFGGDKLPVRGKLRAAMVCYAAGLMVNARRLHRHKRESGADGPPEGAPGAFSGVPGRIPLWLAALCALGAHSRRSRIRHLHHGRAAATITR